MAGARGPEVWRTDAWREEATGWLDAVLTRAGSPRAGAVEQPRVRPWGTLLCAPVAGDGRVWLKAMAPGTDAEAPLYEVLARVAPEHVLQPLAVDAERGWIVLPDGGTTLTDAAGDDAAAVADGMRAAMSAYAALQLAVVPHVEALLAAGVADMRPAALPERFDEALAATADWAARPDGGDDAGAHARIAGLRDDVRRWAEELAQAPGGASVDHNDLHASNILVDAEPARFYDWGDSVVAHPFASMLVPMTVVRDFTLHCTDDDPRLLAVRDAYLEPFAAAHGCGTAELVPTLELACRLAKIARSLTWQRAIDATEPDDPSLANWAAAPLATLSSLLDDSPYGGA